MKFEEKDFSIYSLPPHLANYQIAYEPRNTSVCTALQISIILELGEATVFWNDHNLDKSGILVRFIIALGERSIDTGQFTRVYPLIKFLVRPWCQEVTTWSCLGNRCRCDHCHTTCLYDIIS